jgi:copper(I)-binding protein
MAIVAACSSTGGGTATAGTLTVTGAWARPSMTMALAGAAYLTITNGSDKPDTLLGVTTPAAKSPELHQTTADASGMMAMHPVDKLDVPAGQTVKLEPGGYHIMLIGLTAELVAGSTIELTLQFEKAGAITVTAEVRAS